MPAKVSLVTPSNHTECCLCFVPLSLRPVGGVMFTSQWCPAAQGYACLRRDLAEVRIKGIQVFLWPPARVTKQSWPARDSPSFSTKSSVSRDNLVPDRLTTTVTLPPEPHAG